MGNGHNLPLSLHGIRVEGGDLVQQPVHGADVVREQGFAHQPEQQCYDRQFMCPHAVLFLYLLMESLRSRSTSTTSEYWEPQVVTKPVQSFKQSVKICFDLK